MEGGVGNNREVRIVEGEETGGGRGGGGRAVHRQNLTWLHSAREG